MSAEALARLRCGKSRMFASAKGYGYYYLREEDIPIIEQAMHSAEQRAERAEAQVAAIREAMRGAPMERLDTHGWIECVWCHARRPWRSDPDTLVHGPGCKVLILRLLLAAPPETP